jgi:hypothetical protein
MSFQICLFNNLDRFLPRQHALDHPAGDLPFAHCSEKAREVVAPRFLHLLVTESLLLRDRLTCLAKPGKPRIHPASGRVDLHHDSELFEFGLMKVCLPSLHKERCEVLFDHVPKPS